MTVKQIGESYVILENVATVALNTGHCAGVTALYINGVDVDFDMAENKQRLADEASELIDAIRTLKK